MLTTRNESPTRTAPDGTIYMTVSGAGGRIAGGNDPRKLNMSIDAVNDRLSVGDHEGELSSAGSAAKGRKSLV
jgi:hypothetical protein